MGWIEVISAVAAGAACGSIAGSVAGYYAGWQFKVQLDQLVHRVDSLWGTQNSQKGVAAKEQMTLEKIQVAGKIAGIMKEPGDAKEKLGKIFNVAAEHPELALKSLEKLGR